MSHGLAIETMAQAAQRYFDLMYDNDVSRFDEVFATSAQLHGLIDAAVRVLPAREYKAILAATPSPASKGAPRLEGILFVDVASPTQAMIKVRVRIDAIQYVDYLSYHRIDGTWLITAKSFHVERRFDVPVG